MSAPTRTVKNIADWLIAHSKDFALPLKSIRLLASPSRLEESQDSSLKNLLPATLHNVQIALLDWRTAASTSPDNATLFYFAGHGIQRSKGDSVLLLEDFLGGPSQNLLDHAVSTSNIYNGMANFISTPSLAKKQFYFIDACRSDIPKLRQFEAQQTASVFMIEAGGIDDRTAPMFFASVAGRETYGIKGEETLFGKDFLACLNGRAGDKMVLPDGTRGWCVTIGTLADAMSKLVNTYNARSKLIVRSLNIDKLNAISVDELICKLQNIPLVACTLKLDPDVTATFASIGFDSPSAVSSARVNGPFPNPFSCDKPAGIYAIDAILPDAAKPQLRDLPQELVNVQAPFFEYDLRFHP